MRRGITTDGLGINEAMDEKDAKGQPLNYTGRYYLCLPTSRNELFDIMHKRHIETMNALQMFTTGNYRVLDKPPVDRTLFEAKKNNLLTFLNNSNVQDMQFIPSNDL